MANFMSRGFIHLVGNSLDNLDYNRRSKCQKRDISVHHAVHRLNAEERMERGYEEHKREQQTAQNKRADAV